MAKTISYNSNFNTNTPTVYTPLPIIKKDNNDKYVTWLDAVDFGSLTSFGLKLNDINSSYHDWSSDTINSWQSFFQCIEDHFVALQAKIDELNGKLSQISSIMWENTSALSYNTSSSEPNILNNRTIKITYAGGNSTSNQKATGIVAQNNSGVNVPQWYGTAGTYKLYATYQGKTSTNYITCTVTQETQQLTVTKNGSTYSTLQGVNASWAIKSSNSVSGADSDKFSITGTGTTATVSHKNWPTLKGTVSITINGASSATIESGSSVTIKVKYTPASNATYTGYIFASASGYNTSAGYSHSETNNAEAIPTSLTLTGLSTQTVSLNSNTHEGTITITPSNSGSVGVSGYNGSVSITVNESQPKTPFYWYTGTVKPTSTDNPSNNLASEDLKPVLGDGTARYPGWRLIGDSLDNISESNTLYNGGDYNQCININADFDVEDYYIALPVGLGLYDSDGKNYTNDYLFEPNVTIAGHQYNIFKDRDSDVLFVIY